MIIFTVEDIVTLAALGICVVIIAGFIIYGKIGSMYETWCEKRKSKKKDND